MKHLKTVEQGITLGMGLGILLDRLQRLEAHLVNGESVELFGERSAHSAGLGLRHRVVGPGEAAGAAIEYNELFADLGVRWQVSGTNPVSQHGRRLPFGDIELARIGCVQPVCLGPLSIGNERPVKPSSSLESNLPT